jgi:DNA (cytosine-5)-methyltransferase 1
MLTSRGLGVVLGDLASLGYDAKWGVLGAADVGAPHQRDRIWIVAYTSSQRGKTRIANSTRWEKGKSTIIDYSSDDLANPKNSRDVWRNWLMGFAEQEHDGRGSQADGCGKWWKTQS